MTRKGLTCEIYQCSGGNFSNRGISSRVNTVVVTNVNLCQIFEPSESMPEVMIKTKNIGGQLYVYAEPLKTPNGRNMIGPMNGGTFIHSSDSRWSEFLLKNFGWQGPVPLHDRWETQEQYDRLSS